MLRSCLFIHITEEREFLLIKDFCLNESSCVFEVSLKFSQTVDKIIKGECIKS